MLKKNIFFNNNLIFLELKYTHRKHGTVPGILASLAFAVGPRPIRFPRLGRADLKGRTRHARNKWDGELRSTWRTIDSELGP
jgi:hypothetical protein